MILRGRRILYSLKILLMNKIFLQLNFDDWLAFLPAAYCKGRALSNVRLFDRLFFPHRCFLIICACALRKRSVKYMMISVIFTVFVNCGCYGSWILFMIVFTLDSIDYWFVDNFDWLEILVFWEDGSIVVVDGYP